MGTNKTSTDSKCRLRAYLLGKFLDTGLAECSQSPGLYLKLGEGSLSCACREQNELCFRRGVQTSNTTHRKKELELDRDPLID